MARKGSSDPVFIFTDPGVDDALAIVMATSKALGLSVIGACAVDGNVPARIASRNLANLLKLLGAEDIPVFESDVNDPKHEYPYHVHGKNGLGNVSLTKSTSKITKDGVAEFLETKGRFRILSLGPLTAVAELIGKSPDIAKQISECVMMGGGIDRGNVTPYAEFNIYSNSKAADRVFRSSIPKVLVPLDVTEKVSLYRADLELLERSSQEVTKKLAAMLRFYFEFQRKSSGFFEAYMHDPSAVIAMVSPKLFRLRRADIRVDTTGKTRGKTIVEFSASGSTKVAVSADEDSVRSEIMKILIA